MLKRSGGARQRIWNLLFMSEEPITAPEIAKQVVATQESVRLYLNGLARYGFAEHQVGGWILVKKTGPQAPAYSTRTGDLRDWNIDKPMSATELEQCWKQHGGTMSDFAREAGLHQNSITRLRQMMSGQRPVTTNVESAVRSMTALD